MTWPTVASVLAASDAKRYDQDPPAEEQTAESTP